MAKFAALPLYTDAFIADTIHLNAAQTGAYIMLLMTAWRTTDCKLPDDDKLLARYSRMDLRSWKANKDVIMSFWKKDDQQKWWQARLVDERKHADDVRNKNVAAGRARALKRHETASAGAQPKASQNPAPKTLPKTLPKDNKNITKKPDDVSAEIWEDFVLHRKQKKSPITATALNGIRKQADAAGWSMKDALAEICARGWQGFNADWVEKRVSASPKQNNLTGWRRELAELIPANEVETWFASAEISGEVMTVDKKFTADWIRQKYAPQLVRVFGKISVESR